MYLNQNIPDIKTSNTLLSRMKLIENLHNRNFIQTNINRPFITLNKSLDSLKGKKIFFKYIKKQR